MNNYWQLLVRNAGLTLKLGKNDQQIQLRGGAGPTVTIYPDGKGGPVIYVAGVSGQYPGVKKLSKDEAFDLAIKLATTGVPKPKTSYAGRNLSLDEINAELATEMNRKDDVGWRGFVDSP